MEAVVDIQGFAQALDEFLKTQEFMPMAEAERLSIMATVFGIQSQGLRERDRAQAAFRQQQMMLQAGDGAPTG